MVTKLEHRAGGKFMNELDLTNTQSIILILVMAVMLILLKRMESHRRSDIKQIAETTSKDLNPYYGRYIQLACINKQGAIK